MASLKISLKKFNIKVSPFVDTKPLSRAIWKFAITIVLKMIIAESR